jgi:hypothetical protein
MTQKPKRKLKNIDFSDDMSHIALVSKHQGGPANGADYSLVLKNLNNPSPEFIQKMQAIQVTMTIPDFLDRFFMLWEEDVEFLSQLLGYVEPPEDEQAEAVDDYNKWIEERFQSFSIIKSLHEAKSLPDALSKLTEQDYLDILTDQLEIEKALKELDKESKDSKADTSTKVENTKVEASASRKKNKEKNMTQATPEMVEKSALTAIEKAMQETQVELQKALEQVKKYEAEKKQAIVKSKTDAVTAVVKDEKQAAVIAKAALALESDEDFTAFIEVVKALQAQVEASDAFKEIGASGSAEEKKQESSLTQAIKAKYAAK